MPLKKIVFILIIIAVIILGFYGVWKLFVLKSNIAPQTAIQEIEDEILPPQPETLPVENNSSNQTPVTIPGKIIIKVPFTSQAPFKIWDVRHEEACEEASLIMLHAYLNDISLTPASAEKEIQDMIDFEIKNYGGYKDTSIEQDIKLYYDFYPPAGESAEGKKLKAIYDFDKNNLKEELAKGDPIIIPAAGRELGNPNFTSPGPIYHNLVIVGYSGNEIITNDPGTRKGEGYRYDIDILYNAIHDFPGDLNKINEGRKAMIVVE